MKVEQSWVCMACADCGVDRVLDLETLGTRDALWHITFPAHEQREVALCAEHGEPLWKLEGLGHVRSGGTMAGRNSMPYHCAPGA